MQVDLISDDAPEPVSLEQAKDWLVIDADLTVHDNVINKCIKAARKYCENYTGLSFKPKTYKATLNGWLNGRKLPHGPNQKVLSVVNGNGATVEFNTITGSNLEYLRGFTVQNTYVDEFGWDGVPKGIYAYGNDSLLPLEAVTPENTFEITYSVGYEAGKLPEDIEMAISKIIKDLFENRGSMENGMTVVASIPLGAKELLAPYKQSTFLV